MLASVSGLVFGGNMEAELANVAEPMSRTFRTIKLVRTD
jgi:hypothetical protein